MDFEWQSHGPGDVTSPFYQLGLQHENKKRKCLSSRRRRRATSHDTTNTLIPIAGTHSAFDSPEKKPLPALRAPNSQPFLFSQPAPPTPKAVFGQPAFQTPRKFDVDVDFSSGAENMSSPEQADNEDTPEQPAKTNKRNSLFNIYGRFAPSPGRGEIPRTKHYSNALARRVEKRRRRHRELGRQIRVDSDDESDRPSSGEGRNGKTGKQGNGQTVEQKQSRISSFSEFFALLEAHPNVPSVLSWWAQLVVNLSLFSLFVYVLFAFVSAIRMEIEQAADEVSAGILAEMAACAKSYVDNRCGGGDRLPALESVCENWERCMNRDPAKVGRAKVTAETIAIIINSFIDPISWKAIVCSLTSSFGLPLTYLQLCFLATISTVTVVSNWSFRSFRNRLNQQGYSGHPYPQQPNHNSSMHPQMQLHQNANFRYYNQQDHRQAPMNGHAEKENEPLMLEGPSRPMDFVTERSRERESHLRTPSPSKRGRRFA